jgi:hypothetical protein
MAKIFKPWIVNGEVYKLQGHGLSFVEHCMKSLGEGHLNSAATLGSKNGVGETRLRQFTDRD